MLDSESELIKLALQGDPAAMRRVVLAITPAIQVSVSGALRRGTSSAARSRTRHEVEDLTQEVLFALFANGGKRLRAWNPEKGLELARYVQLVARHLVVSFLRKRARRTWEDEPVDDESPDVERESPERLAAQKELRGAVLAAIEAELSVQGRRMLTLLVVEERSVAEVCQETNLTPNAVHVWRSRLVKRAEEARRRILRGESADD